MYEGPGWRSTHVVAALLPMVRASESLFGKVAELAKNARGILPAM